jgi:4-hydroxy-3-methylbut-2-enyl diphosphate reductase
MNIIRAEVMGMCFGVRDALKVIAGVSEPVGVTIHGQLVHNEEVLSGLRARGFSMTGEEDRREVPAGPVVLITAHGISDRERARLTEAGKTLVDTTCPLVTRAHQAAQRLRDDGFFVIVIGRRGHVEVQGIVEDLPSHAVVESAEEVTAYASRRIGVVCQTTVPAEHAARVRREIEARNPEAEVRFVDTVCHPTKDHQRSLERLLDRVDAVVVVGGRNSNNTRELAALCRSRGCPALHVQSAADLDPDWFQGVQTVGLTAGTSTLDSTIEGVYQALLRIPLPVAASAGA